MKKDSRIDQYINEANEFAKEIIIHLRKIISEAIPDGEETIKWNSPHFTYNGENICAIMAFKSHLTFTFWRGKELADREKILQDAGNSNMRSIKNIKKISDLPEDKILNRYITEAVNLTLHSSEKG
ncbi:MAG TPA: DUF1801 domain-containing protein [Saprospiraceae bacterium]|jgi:hypothetical protein|nr:DUF1801 domain-containing protein [Saprospiraceae bacterium]WKZ62339.1 MAG: DUF1801 domain-containing protein [Saprospiraceae bacterium]HRN33147.1 DUF1801 domain-containing protein [Saprospiraceae bacterium]HRP83785.1 DUF1801 domain-containing protein [Saprospiraceae bacterium]